MRNSIKHNYTYPNIYKKGVNHELDHRRTMANLRNIRELNEKKYISNEEELCSGSLNDKYCNNCRKQGHLYHQCKLPIMSIGIIVYRILSSGIIEYLMICRKDTLGYIDFMRGKYSIFDKNYIINMLKQMTINEKTRLQTLSFDELWSQIWGDEISFNQYKMEESVSREKFYLLRAGLSINDEFYTLDTLIEESMQYEDWNEPEWGFPKGRRNYQEQEYDCALREFEEETGYKSDYLINIQNLLPFEEIFMGSNYKSYKHKYYLTHMKLEHTLEMKQFQRTEVSKLAWKTYEDCIAAIRPYNIEKKRLITNIHEMLSNYHVLQL
jgi:8-oxo-dGTP pyrophosphatase MutT (NUDIX family)